MSEITVEVELRVNLHREYDPVALEKAVFAEGRRAARELYVRVLQSADVNAIQDSGGLRQRREPFWLATLMGRVRILRYRVRIGDETFHPLDRTLNVDRDEASAAVRLLAVQLARKMSYRDVAKVITELTGEPFSYQTVNRLMRKQRQRR
jgi:hypothetical protein